MASLVTVVVVVVLVSVELAVLAALGLQAPRLAAARMASEANAKVRVFVMWMSPVCEPAEARVQA